MPDLNLLESASMVCTSPKCAGRITRHNLIEATSKGKPTVTGWICTSCNAKTPVVAPVAK